MKFAHVLRQRRLAQSKTRGPPRLPRPKDIFPFFELPLELRETIYNEVLEDREEQLNDEETLKYRTCNTPLISLLLVSKRFKQEYEARALKKMSLQIDDIFAGPIEPKCSWPKPAGKVGTATVSIIVSHRNYPKELAMHKKWLPRLLKQLKSLTILRLTIKVARDSLQENKSGVEGILKWLSATLTAAFVAEVHGAEYEISTETEMGSTFTPMMRWSREKRKLEDIKKEELRDEEN